MKVEYGATTLGDDSAGDFITDLGGSHNRVVQQDPLAFGTAPFTAGRANHTNTRGFQISKQHATHAAAVTWFNTHPDGLGESGLLKITAGAATENLVDAVLVSVDRVELTGVSTVMRYSFTGGQFTST